MSSQWCGTLALLEFSLEYSSRTQKKTEYEKNIQSRIPVHLSLYVIEKKRQVQYWFPKSPNFLQGNHGWLGPKWR
jgi:hypothetical protein